MERRIGQDRAIALEPVISGGCQSMFKRFIYISYWTFPVSLLLLSVLSLYVIYIHTHMYIYMYIYIYRERDIYVYVYIYTLNTYICNIYI